MSVPLARRLPWLAPALVLLACDPPAGAPPPPAPAVSAPVAPSASVALAAHSAPPGAVACSHQNAVALESFLQGPGVRGKVVAGGVTSEGWILLDTAATVTRVRTKANGDAEVTEPAHFALGTSWSADVQAGASNALWGFDAPDGTGTQVATLETDVFVSWAVRIATSEKQVYLSDDGAACSADLLRAGGFHRMDTTGYYQRGGTFASVGSFAAPTVPTVEVEILGTRVRAQIDTGFDVSDTYVQINAKLLKVLASKLGKVTGQIPLGGPPQDTYVPAGGAVDFIDSDTNKSFARVSKPKFLVKTGTESIAAWDVPAALISAPAFFGALDTVELRADQKAVWAVARAAVSSPDGGR